ncbi:hypothetical protein TSAR_008837 [Trichomalopsis sarcophagae]|uniref:Uncharacterized protein n=1 Tax=Trichomalopsis sarcophagae TaxID=543379 RepID=A0A232F3P9_9HYME|nr:hypothetical protein TSAR_008837 [Trichomalopsis sarcophagae]
MKFIRSVEIFSFTVLIYCYHIVYTGHANRQRPIQKLLCSRIIDRPYAKRRRKKQVQRCKRERLLRARNLNYK